MTDELKLCPFCGGRAEKYYLKPALGATLFAVRCETCFAMSLLSESEEEAVDAWNTRASYEDEDFFWLRKPDRPIATTTIGETSRIDSGFRCEFQVDIIKAAALEWENQIGDDVMRRLCEVWNTRAERTCVKQREWEDDPNGGGAWVLVCSECGELLAQDGEDGPFDGPNYCPNCGAKVMGASSD